MNKYHIFSNKLTNEKFSLGPLAHPNINHRSCCLLHHHHHWHLSRSLSLEAQAIKAAIDEPSQSSPLLLFHISSRQNKTKKISKSSLDAIFYSSDLMLIQHFGFWFRFAGPGWQQALHLFLPSSTPWSAFSTTPPLASTSRLHTRWPKGFCSQDDD